MAQMQLKKVRKSKKGETIVEVLPNNVKDNPNETDAQIIERMRERFQILDDMTQASIDGVVRGMVVTGPPGVGKSFGVEQVLEKNSLFDTLAGNKLRFEVIKGASSAIGLYKVLFENADKNNVLVLDANGDLYLTGSYGSGGSGGSDNLGDHTATQDLDMDGNDILNVGQIVAVSITSSHITSSTVITSGSNVFGDNGDDSHEFIGAVTASSTISASGDGYFYNLNTAGNISASGTIIANNFKSPF